LDHVARGIEASIGSLPPGANVAAFREPPRIWVREPAAGKSIALDWTLYARELREPVFDSLIVRIVSATASRPKRSRERSQSRTPA
jgi:hypothetical protein